MRRSFFDSNVLVLDTPRQSVTDAAQKSDAEPQHLSKAQRHKLKQVHEAHRRRLELGKVAHAPAVRILQPIALSGRTWQGHEELHLHTCTASPESELIAPSLPLKLAPALPNEAPHLSPPREASLPCSLLTS